MKKFIISAQALNKALHKLSNAVVAKPTLPVLGSIWCRVKEKEIEFVVTDLEVIILYREECETTGGDFEFLLPFQLLQKIASLSKNQPLFFSQEKKCIKITTGTDVYEIKPACKIEEFPQLPTIPTKKSMSVDAGFIAKMTMALKTLGNDELRPAFTNVLLELRKKETSIASTNGSHLLFSYTMQLEAPLDIDLLINPKVIKTLGDIESAHLSWTEKVIAFTSETMTVIATRLDLKFANYRAIIPPDHPGNLLIKKDALVEALNKCNINSNPFKKTILLLKKDGHVTFISNDEKVGIDISVDAEATYTGEIEQVAFGSDKMLRLMQQVDYENIDIAVHSEKRAILFRSADDAGYLALLMPMEA